LSHEQHLTSHYTGCLRGILFAGAKWYGDDIFYNRVMTFHRGFLVFKPAEQAFKDDTMLDEDMKWIS